MAKEKIFIGDTEYVPKTKDYLPSSHMCYVVQNGWIFEGEVVEENERFITLVNASVVRSWSNGRGIGGLANPEFKKEYTLDYIGDMQLIAEKVLFQFPLEW